MKKISITYNPFLLTTSFQVDGKKPRNNSSLDFPKQRLQEWAESFPQIMVDEYKDHNATIEFRGTLDDFNDLKEILVANDSILHVSSYTHHRTPDVEEVEKEIVLIYEKIQKGPIKALKDDIIKSNFESAIRSEFTINVVATMSSGKSTLINSLLGQRLMPVAQMATTATIVRVIATNQEFFSGLAYDRNGKEIAREKALTYKIMEEWNKNSKISTIDVYGPIPCVDRVGMRLVLMDTPGPNNSRDENHKAMTYGMLESSEKSLVLFVMNATALNINDEKNFLDYVCGCMKKGGKQSRDRFIFAVNKINCFNPKDGDNVRVALESVKEGLDKHDIREPNIFPVGALTALEIRTDDEDPETLDTFRRKCKKYTEFHFEDYYDFNHLSLNSRSKLQEIEDSGDEDQVLLIHTGVPSIEEAIRMYVNKYARTMKVKDLVDSFNMRLKELKTVADLEKRLSKNRAEREQLLKEISHIEAEIQDGHTAQEYADRINKIDVLKGVKSEIENQVGGLQERIDGLIRQYDNKTKMLKDDALKIVESLNSQRVDMQSQLEVRIGLLFDNSVKKTFEEILDLYRERLGKLGFKTKDSDFEFNPIDIVQKELADLTELINKSSQAPVDEGRYVIERVKKTKQVERSIFNPFRWFGNKYKTVEYEEDVKRWVANYKVYVDMSQVVNAYFLPLQLNLQDVEKSVPEHIENEIARLKKQMQGQLSMLERLLVKKLENLKKMTDSSDRTEAEIKKQESDLEWMNGIIDDVNKLVNY